MNFERNPLSLPELFAKHPEEAAPWIDDLAKDLEEGLTKVLQDDALFLSHSNDFGETDASFEGPESIKGWRLYFDDPMGRVGYTGWGETGELIAYLDASVSADCILSCSESPVEDYQSLLEDDDAYQKAEDQARLALRDMVDPYFLQGRMYPDYKLSSHPLSFNACKEAIVNAIIIEMASRDIDFEH